MGTPNAMMSIVRRTSPVLWAIPMGTGSISILFFAFPYGRGSQPMAIVSLIFNFLNLGLFILFNALTIARFVVHPGSFARLLKHPNYSLFFACYPMGATTILNVSVNVIYQFYAFGGKAFIYFLWVLWWINVAISALCFWGGTHLMITRHSHSLEAMTASWILPVVTFVVASSTGAVVADAVREFSPHSALVTITFSAFLLTAGLLLASMMLTVYIMRLVVYGFPSGLSILSVFLPLGVSAQAGYSVSLIGAQFRFLLPLTSAQAPFFSWGFSGDTIDIVCSVASFLLWSWAVLWISYALLGLFHTLRRTKIEFKLTAWGLVFPNGVFANLTVHLADVFDSSFFRVVGAIYSILTFLLWCYISFNSILLLPALFRGQSDDSRADEAEKTQNMHSRTMTQSPPPDISMVPSITDTAYACHSAAHGFENTLVG